jgi:hypothetical protein
MFDNFSLGMPVSQVVNLFCQKSQMLKTVEHRYVK